MHQKEMQIVRFSMAVLFSALMIVYLLLYQIKGTKIVEELSMANSGIEIEQYENIYTGNNTKNVYTGDNELSIVKNENTQESTGINISIGKSLFAGKYGTGKGGSGTAILLGNTGNKEGIQLLSGTALRYGIVESAEKLGISYQYALKDQKDIYYVFLGKNIYNFEDIVRKLGGTTYKINTEQEIIQNKLFGESIMFINLPEYKEKKVIMIVDINNQFWLLQIDYTTYHNSKTYIKNIFTE